MKYKLMYRPGAGMNGITGPDHLVDENAHVLCGTRIGRRWRTAGHDWGLVEALGRAHLCRRCFAAGHKLLVS